MFRILTNYLPIIKQVCFKNNVKKYQTVSTNLIQPKLCACVTENHNLQQLRFKGKKDRRKIHEEDEDDDEDNTEEEDNWDRTLTDRNTKLVTVKVNSLRADLILKAGLGIARNKVETLFYESRIRANGKKIFKKSAPLQVGDEVDIIKGLSTNNPAFLTIGRVEILSMTDKNEGLSVRLRRCKSLVIENYPDPWKPSTASDI